MAQTPYIGSKISLISKLDIRYEGILYTVDTNESTIALAKVRSFGTEERQTDNPVAARDDVYEYIIFKASDIKDLIVCETPKIPPVSNNGLPYDPAIVSVSKRGPAGDAPVQPSAGSSRSTTPPHEASPRAPTQHNQGQRGNYRGRGGNFTGQRGHGGNQQYRNQYPQRNYHHYPPRNGNPVPGEKVKFDKDFDFEKANEKFGDMLSELQDFKIDDNTDTSKTEETAAFYDKKSSFFDSISCEASEKAEGRRGRADWKKERETNTETFGQNSVRALGYRRGFGRGMRGNRYNGYNNYGGNRGQYNNGSRGAYRRAPREEQET